MSCFNNPDVETAVQEALAQAGVKVYSGYILADWALEYVSDDDDNDYGEVTSVSFTSDDDPLTLSCVVSTSASSLG